MPRFGSKKKLTDYLYSRVVIIFLIVIVALLAISVYERYEVEQQMAARRIDVEEELQVRTQRKEDLEAKVKYLEGDRGIEEEIRKHFDVAKEGEQVIILLGDDEEVIEEKTELVKEKKWYQFWR